MSLSIPGNQLYWYLDPKPNFLKIMDGWKKYSADIRLSRIIAISEKYG